MPLPRLGFYCRQASGCRRHGSPAHSETRPAVPPWRGSQRRSTDRPNGVCVVLAESAPPERPKSPDRKDRLESLLPVRGQNLRGPRRQPLCLRGPRRTRRIAARPFGPRRSAIGERSRTAPRSAGLRWPSSTRSARSRTSCAPWRHFSPTRSSRRSLFSGPVLAT
jgi:hypothetical protein